MEISNMFVNKKCDICGKKFYPSIQWVYKKYYATEIKWFCSWTCFRKAETKFKKRSKRIVK